jgi:hypothetical protein
MSINKKKPAPLEYKPDLEEAAKRWDAFYEGEMIDRPVICITAPIEGIQGAIGSDYHERVHGDMDDIIDRAIQSAKATYYGGEAVPAFNISFGPDEIAVFTGSEFKWSPDSGDTNWSVPYVEDWKKEFPITLKEDHPLWQRMLEFYRRAADKMAGKMLLVPPDLHTNMDLLAAIRGPQKLCIDTLDQPEMIDRAMDDARAIFPKVWYDIAKAGRMDELGYCNGIYSMEGTAYLQCDFSCMIGPDMFRRWVLSALEEEAEIVKHVVYHWDGPGALVHTDDLVASKGLHTMSYVPGTGYGGHIEYLDLFKRVQEGGKAVQFWGGIDEIKKAHKELKPNKVFYSTWAPSQAEVEKLLDWFVKNT